MFKILLNSFTACPKSSVIFVIAAISKLPNECPSTWSSSKRYWKSCSSTGSVSLKAEMTLRISPGAGISISLRILPVLPPSSATVTIVVISIGNCLSPRASTDNPVPPPISTSLIRFIIIRHFQYVHRDVAHIHDNQSFLSILSRFFSLMRQSDAVHLYNLSQ